MLNFGEDIVWVHSQKMDSYGRYIWVINFTNFTAKVGQKFVYNAKYWAGHGAGGTKRNRMAISITSGC